MRSIFIDSSSEFQFNGFSSDFWFDVWFDFWFDFWFDLKDHSEEPLFRITDLHATDTALDIVIFDNMRKATSHGNMNDNEIVNYLSFFVLWVSCFLRNDVYDFTIITKLCE